MDVVNGVDRPIGDHDAETLTSRAVERSVWRRLGSELIHRKKGLTGAVIILIAVLIALGSPLLAPYDPTAQAWRDKFAPPSVVDSASKHLLGADNLGRDILSRTMFGSQISLSVGIIVILVSAVIGSLLGGIAGLKGGLIETLVMRIVDLQLSFPFILLALVFMAILGPGFLSMLVALTVALWVNYARLVRGQTLQVRELEFVQAARVMGGSDRHIIFKHIMPNVLPSILVLGTLDMAFVMIFESSLTFLGLGVQPPTPSWGIMLSEGRNYLHESPWMTLAPGVALVLTVIGINLFGDWLRDVLDPSLQRH